jgi:putative endopeptidase
MNPKLTSLAALAAMTLCPIGVAQVPATVDTGISLANMDTSIRPGDNFFLYANGGFITRTTLPPDRASLGVFTILSDTSEHNIAAIIDDAAKARTSAGSNEARIAALYHSYMDQRAIES